MSTGIISHRDCLLHEMGHSHPEQPARLKVIEKELMKSGLLSDLKQYEAPLATFEQLNRVHPRDYIEHIFEISPQKGLISIDSDTWMNPFTLQAALRAAGAVVYAVDLVMRKEVNSVFCNIRPPGHHAEKSQAMGFCFFNNIAIGVAHALEAYHLERVAIIDFDVHHGNGTEDVFENDERVLFCSSFQHPFYPFGGTEINKKHIINLPLPAGTTGKLFREVVTSHWLSQIENFQPQIIFISAGFDAHERDNLANISLHEEDYAWITQKLRTIADHVCEGRIVSVLEGGYALEVLGRCAVAHINALSVP